MFLTAATERRVPVVDAVREAKNELEQYLGKEMARFRAGMESWSSGIMF